jgi:asparagine synthase (glutamine-hydrolysing)
VFELCGIFGVTACDGQLELREEFREAYKAMEHRGPDDQREFYDGHTYLGHCRLKIIDLSEAARQPMSNEDGTIWIVYNGEIYNYPELRKLLQSKGHRLNSNSDTETILHLYEDYGEKCLKFLRGMFSFAIWDRRKNQLFLARDKLGIKPLYYSFQNGRFAFASEIKPLLIAGLARRKINMTALKHYLSFGAIPTPLTIFKDIRSLTPGCFLVFKQGFLSIDRYWHLPVGKPKANKSLTIKEYAVQLRNLLEEIMAQHMVSDVPLGAFLSGGLDSSIVVGLMSKIVARPIKTFCVGYDVGGEEYNELKYANIASLHFGTDHNQVIVTEKQVANELGKIISHLDQPSHDALNSYFVSKAAAKEVKVVLSGLGGDELFAGYSVFKFARKLNQYKKIQQFIPEVVPKVLRKLEDSLPPALKVSWYWRGLVGILGGYPKIADQYSVVKLFFREEEKANLLTQGVWEDGKGGERFPQSSSIYLDWLAWSHRDSDPVNTLSYLELSTYLRDTLLRDTDVMSMAHSLEVRVPFLDHQLVEFVANIPPELKLSDDLRSKYILVESVRDLLPSRIVHRKKMGFGVPMNIWLKGVLRPIVEECLSAHSIKNRGLFQPEAVKRVKREFYSVRTDNPRVYQISQKVWLLTVFELWCRECLDKIDLTISARLSA